MIMGIHNVGNSEEVRGHVTTDICLPYRLYVCSYFTSEITTNFWKFWKRLIWNDIVAVGIAQIWIVTV